MMNLSESQGDRVKALITGASSGIGYDMSKYLATKNCELILVARNKEKLEALQNELNKTVKTKIIVMDLANEQKLKELYVICKNENIDILINNAGFGLAGDFSELDLVKEMNMIDVNIKALHTLTKLFLKDMIKRNAGYILNVASSASFQPGPLMATYYATKAYVLRLSEALNEELRAKKINVHVSILCPGPVDTNFNKVANVNFSVRPLSSEYVARYAIDKMFQKEMIIVPGVKMKLAKFFGRFLSDRALMKITYQIQKKKFE